MDTQAYLMVKKVYNLLKDKQGVEDLTDRELIYITTKLEDIVDFFAEPQDGAGEPQPGRDIRPWWKKMFF